MLTESQQAELRAHYNPDGSDLRYLQNNLLDILVEFDVFARRNNLTYSISYGTLLGAIRHHGFIPWDDDADIMLTRQEWNELIKYVNQDGYLTEKLYIRNRVHPVLEIASKGIVDIFIMDYAPKNFFLDKIKGFVCLLLCVLIKCKNRIIRRQYNRFKWWFLFIPFAYFLSMNKMLEWKDKVAQWFTPEEMSDEYSVRLYNGDPNALRTKHLYGLVSGKKIDVDFEDHKLMSIPQYDAFLRVWYGEYMQLPKRPNNLGRVTGAELCDIR